MFLTDDELRPLTDRLMRANATHSESCPGDSAERQPVHVVYGGANLFKAGTAARLGRIALKSLRVNAEGPEDFAGCLGIAPELAGAVYARVAAKLEREPIEDYRIDFEDGYGYRADDEEDGHAVSAARELAAGIGQPHFPRYCGFRVKPLTEALRERSIRTFQLFMGALLEATGGQLPEGFVVMLPKVTSSGQVAGFCDLLELFEARAGLAAGSMRIEIMIETVRAVVADDGRIAIPGLIAAARGRCRGAHFGAYDYSSDCNLSAMCQGMTHPACDFARRVMQVSLAGSGVMLSDSITSTIPTAIHRGSGLSAEEAEENRQSVRRAWKLHYDDTRRSLYDGFYQGWDLHPAQFPTRYAAVYAFFLEGLGAASARLSNFMSKASQAAMTGTAFDDAATAQGLLNFFLRGMNCGAITETEALGTGLSMDELRTKSFGAIMTGRTRGETLGRA